MNSKIFSILQSIPLFFIGIIPVAFFLLRGSTPEYFFAIFSAAFIACIFLCREYFSQEKDIHQNEVWKKGETIFVILLILLAFLIRFYRLGELSLWWDEFLTGTYVKSILENGIPLSPSGNEYYWRGIPYHYLVALFCYFGGENELMLRLPNVFLSVGILFISYFFAKKVDKKIAIFVLIFLTFSPYSIEYAQFARFYTLNSFLFLVGLWSLWQGVWKRKNIFLVISFGIHFLLNLNSELGNILFGGILAAITLRFLFDNTKERKKRALAKILLVLAPFFVLYIIGNPLYFFEKEIPEGAKKEYQIETSERKGLLLNIPANSFSNLTFEAYDFYQRYHIPFWILAPLIFQTFFIVKRKGFQKYTPQFHDYLLLTFLISSGIFDIVNTFDKAPRLYFLFEPLIVILAFFSVSTTSEILVKKHVPQRMVLFTFTILALFSLHPFFWNQINIQYGDSVEQNPFRSTWSQKIRTDSKTILKFLNANYREGDIWINTMDYTTFYTNLKPDYILNENYRWKNMWREFALLNPKKNEYFDLRTGAIIIPSHKEFLKILEEKKRQKKRVWVTVHGANIETLYTIHIQEESQKFFRNNVMNKVYLSPDGVSSVYLY
ncbi:hypothetical protein IPN35_00645 [Candidatus Peregrinibacteria bacterium]|nr:MAG: hypothetical protein IPN35_00645 [Candidatus Peregrinibacteria bacterium]